MGKFSCIGRVRPEVYSTVGNIQISQMQESSPYLDRTFDKITMDLVTDFTKSNKGNKHILTIIDLLMGWLEVILIPNKSADTITKAFIRHYLPRHMCPWFILSDNGTELKNQIFDKVTKDLGIERIFSAPYHPQSNGKLETFHKFLKPTLKKMCAEDQDN